LAGIVGVWSWFVPGAGEIAEVDADYFVIGMEFVLDGGEGAEEQIAGVGHAGGTARGDAIFGLKKKETGEELIDRDGGLEFGETGSKRGGKINGCVVMFRELGVVSAKEGFRVWNQETAAGAVDEAMLTAG
jgi:hypothetical protein